MDLIPLQNEILRDVKRNSVISKILERLNDLKLVDKKYVSDAEFILYLMNLIEHLVDKKDKLDKKQLLKDILKNHYSASEGELIVIDKIIEFLHTKKQVKKVSYYKIFKCALKEWFKKK